VLAFARASVLYLSLGVGVCLLAFAVHARLDACFVLCVHDRMSVCLFAFVCACACACVYACLFVFVYMRLCVCVCSRDVNGDQDEVIHSRVRFVGATKKYCN
jgi:hypothetical protein